VPQRFEELEHPRLVESRRAHDVVEAAGVDAAQGIRQKAGDHEIEVGPESIGYEPHAFVGAGNEDPPSRATRDHADAMCVAASRGSTGINH
jgi:hypothetical protein